MIKRFKSKKVLIVMYISFSFLCITTILTGCVERRLTIKTEPADAIIWLNDKEVGRSPVRLPFTWYGDYDIIIRKEGYNTLKTYIKLKRPWYQIPPIDLFAEVLWPGIIYDEQVFEFKLKPITPPNTEKLLEQAKEMRTTAQKGRRKTKNESK